MELKDYLHRKLNLARCGCGPGQQTRRRVQGPSTIENICVDSLNRRCEIGMIEDIENLGAELDVEPLRDALDVVVFEQGKIQLCDTRTNQDVSPRIAAQIEALRINGCDRRS